MDDNQTLFTLVQVCVCVYVLFVLVLIVDTLSHVYQRTQLRHRSIAPDGETAEEDMLNIIERCWLEESEVEQDEQTNG